LTRRIWAGKIQRGGATDTETDEPHFVGSQFFRNAVVWHLRQHGV